MNKIISVLTACLFTLSVMFVSVPKAHADSKLTLYSVSCTYLPTTHQPKLTATWTGRFDHTETFTGDTTGVCVGIADRAYISEDRTCKPSICCHWIEIHADLSIMVTDQNQLDSEAFHSTVMTDF